MPSKDPETVRRYGREHYARKKQYYIDRNKRIRRERAIWLEEYKASLECKACGQNHPACLQFHHRDPKSKVDDISRVAPYWSIKRLEIEIKKCDVLCANCHAILHFEEKKAKQSSENREVA